MRPTTPTAPGAAPVSPSAALLSDAHRIAAVRRFLTAGVPPHSLDRLTRFAAQLLEAEYSQVSLIADEQVVASAYGLHVEDADRVGAAADSLCTLTLDGSTVAISDARNDRRVADLPPVTGGVVQAYLGIPLVDAGGFVIGALCVYDGRPRTWSPQQVGILNEIATSVMTELELRALSADVRNNAARLDMALSAAEIGSYDLDIATGRLQWDDRLLSLFGYTRQEFPDHWDGFAARVHDEDLPQVQEAVDRAVQAIGDFAAEYRIVVPGIGVRWVQARGRVLPDMAGRPSRLLGAAFDCTELRTTRDQLARVLETMTDAFFSVDRSWRFVYVNSEAERVLLRRREELLGRNIWDEFPEAVSSTFQERYEHAVSTGEMVSFEEFFPELDTWFEVRAWPTPDGLSVYFHDINSRRRAQAEREAAVIERERAYAAAEAANSRLALLADATTALSASLEPRAVLQTLSDLVVPQLGDYVVVALLAETAGLLDGYDQVADPNSLQVVHVRHARPELEPALAELMTALPLSIADAYGVGAVVRTGTPEWLPEIPDEALVALAPDESRLAALRSLQAGAGLTVPLISRGRRLGAMTVLEPRGGGVDRALLVDLAARAAVALDNALLYGAERRNGLTLQHSLLPRDLPDLPGLDIAASYIPGATGAYVGGDWYQGVPYDDGIVVAMGDVMGHGMRSAARMGQLRAIVATLALEGHPPGELLRRLAASTDLLLDLELATLLVARYSLRDRTLTVASAGHPPPLLAPADGEPVFIEVTPGPPIGTIVSDYRESTVAVPPGATLVLYTDGLVENRAESLTDGLERLRQVVGAVQPPSHLLRDHILAELGRATGGDDDLALLVLSHA